MGAGYHVVHVIPSRTTVLDGGVVCRFWHYHLHVMQQFYHITKGILRATSPTMGDDLWCSIHDTAIQYYYHCDDTVFHYSGGKGRLCL
jgi:hypothetical protein